MEVGKFKICRVCHQTEDPGNSQCYSSSLKMISCKALDLNVNLTYKHRKETSKIIFDHIFEHHDPAEVRIKLTITV
jgi:hypothetical protein